jgi:surfeit locus 1 family protein
MDTGSPGGGPNKVGPSGADWKGALLLLPAAIAGCLGVWQMQRKQWKEELIAERHKQLREAPVDLFGLDRGPSEYLPVKTCGEFQHDASVFVGPRVKSDMGTATPGYVVITPLYSKQWQKFILVNRGWVPEGWRNSPESQEPKGTVDVSGVIRHSEEPNSFVPDNQPGKQQWFWIDAPSIAEACHLAADTPLMEVFDSSQGMSTKSEAAPTPMDVLARRSGRGGPDGHAKSYPLSKGIGDLVDLPVMPADHLHYAMIWVSLSVVTAGMAFHVLRKPFRAPKRKS